MPWHFCVHDTHMGKREVENEVEYGRPFERLGSGRHVEFKTLFINVKSKQGLLMSKETSVHLDQNRIVFIYINTVFTNIKTLFAMINNDV